MRILFIGDIIGRPGRAAVKKYLSGHNYDLIIANGENSAAGFGITDKVYRELISSGVSAVTGGNHTWDKPDTDKHSVSWDNFIRPLNYPAGSPGVGFRSYEVCGVEIIVACLLGRVFMRSFDDPFAAFDKLWESHKNSLIIIDFHAEATAEKNAFGLYADGRAIAVIGTHTHVQTNDLRILPSGKTLYLTDAGMCGSIDSVIGMEKDAVLERYLTPFTRRMEVELKGRICFCGVEFSVDASGKIEDYRLINIVDGVL